MLRVIGCITQDHDPSLLILALLVCCVSATTTARLLGPGLTGALEHGRVRLGAATAAFGGGIWTTHFIALLAFHPNIGFGYDIGLCLLSLGLSFVGAGAAFCLSQSSNDRRIACLAAGAALASGIGLTHFVGASALRFSGVIHYDARLVVASLVLGSLSAVAAFALLANQRCDQAAVLLTLAVLLTHFTGMAAMSLELAGPAELPSTSMTKLGLALGVGTACLVLLALAAVASVIENRMADQRINEARRLRNLANATFEGLVFERDGRIVDANQAMTLLAGTDTKRLIGLRLDDIIPGIDLTAIPGDQIPESALLLPNGKFRPVEVLWRRTGDGNGHVVAVRDLSRVKAAESQIERLVRFDPLTGLANRTYFEELAQKAQTQAQRSGGGVCVLHIHLGRLDTAIEALGPAASEQLLLHAARRLTGTVRPADTVARFGWSEFAIIQPLVDQAREPAAATTAGRIVREIALPFLVEDCTVELAANVGIALFPEDCSEAGDLVRCAAMALRQAKMQGLGHWRRFEPAMDLILRTRQTLERDLRLALSENQLTLNYQPFVEIATQEIAGYEALLRWDHPERGRISPVDFVPLAEECGLIVPIGSWVLATACAEAASWANPAIVSVNLSPAQFGQPGVVSTVANVLTVSGLSPARLELEITEGILMKDTQNALQILSGLKALGVKIAMDDFGTGYSSLSYLRKFPFDKIKIDRSFITDADDNNEAETIVQAIIAMSRSLKLAVTAEGVETEHQLRMLHAHGCMYAQGYLLGRPVPSSQLTQQAGDHRAGVKVRLAGSLATPFVWQE